MVRIVIDTKYLHYKIPSMKTECKVQGGGSFAYCDFMPEGGVQCNVISWKCLDIDFLDIKEESDKEFYHSAVEILKQYQDSEKECLNKVSERVENIRSGYYNSLRESFAYLIGNNPTKVASQKGVARDNAVQPYRHDHNNLLNDIVQDALFGFSIFVIYVSGDSLCHDSNIVIPLLPTENMNLKLVGSNHVVEN